MAEAKGFDLNAWMQRTGRSTSIKGPPGYGIIVKMIYPRVQCVDGFSMSVQASDTCYCTPRTNQGPYTAVEVGYPSAFEELLTNPEDQSRPLETVYGWVDVGVVERIVDKHGGIAHAN